MSTITKIEIQKNNKDKVNIFIDGVFYCGMYSDTMVKFGLKDNMEIALEDLDKMLVDSEKHLAFNKVINYIGEGVKTTKQVRDYLKKKEYSDTTITYVIAKLKEYRYLDDNNYADIYIRSYEKKYGKNKLYSKLAEKGIAKNIIEDKLKEHTSDSDVILALATKKLGNKAITYDNLTKTMRFLASRGFDYDEISIAIKTLKNNMEN